jgi:hypothetical protein
MGNVSVSTYSEASSFQNAWNISDMLETCRFEGMDEIGGKFNTRISCSCANNPYFNSHFLACGLSQVGSRIGLAYFNIIVYVI